VLKRLWTLLKCALKQIITHKWSHLSYVYNDSPRPNVQLRLVQMVIWEKCRANFCITAKYIKLLSHSWFAYSFLFGIYPSGVRHSARKTIRHSARSAFRHLPQYSGWAVTFRLIPMRRRCSLPCYTPHTSVTSQAKTN